MNNKLTDTHRIAASLPDDFILGVATAAYQIEGAVQKDGRGPSIWDWFSQKAGQIVNNDNGNIACDHYHRWNDDLDLIKNMQIDAYRFSFSWSRIQADGKSAINPKGISFYDRLIDGVLDRGLDAFATLYHWDLPLSLHNDGGWTHADTAARFADYAGIMADHFGDRLSSLTTFNEPWCSSMMGYLYGVHAPGVKDLAQAITVVHHQHKAHGLAVQRIKSSKPELPVGIVLNLQSVYPGSSAKASEDAAKRHKIFHNGIFIEPLFEGRYPAEFVDQLGHLLPPDWQDDLSTIHQPLNFWGLNYYTPARVLHDDQPGTDYPATKPVVLPDSTPVTDIGWEIDASTLKDLLIEIYDRYSLPPCFITENGACFNDQPEDGVVHDTRRINYLSDHLSAISDACQSGVPLKGYFAWSLMDNFEWAEGYTMRFGLIHVDYETQKRTVKNSGRWFTELAAARNRP